MGKFVLDSSKAIIREANERSHGIRGLEWHVSKEAVSIFQSLAEFVAPRRAGYAPPNLIGCIICHSTIPVFIDDMVPRFQAHLQGDGFESVMKFKLDHLPYPPPRTGIK